MVRIPWNCILQMDDSLDWTTQSWIKWRIVKVRIVISNKFHFILFKFETDRTDAVVPHQEEIIGLFINNWSIWWWWGSLELVFCRWMIPKWFSFCPFQEGASAFGRDDVIPNNLFAWHFWVGSSCCDWLQVQVLLFGGLFCNITGCFVQPLFDVMNTWKWLDIGSSSGDIMRKSIVHRSNNNTK